VNTPKGIRITAGYAGITKSVVVTVR
jgi:hypothetical protein